MPEKEQTELPSEVLGLLKTSTIGYLSVRSPKGNLYSYPVAFYYSDYKVYFMTPISAAKLRFIRTNPEVSFLVDNHLVTKEALGAMMQGEAKVFNIAKTVVNIFSVGPKMVKFAEKYPGLFTFYAKGKELPDERKLYNYRLVRITPTKIVFWKGYGFGKVPVKSRVAHGDSLAEASDDEKMKAFADLLKTADMSDEELVPTPVEPRKPPQWTESMASAVREGTISDEDRSTIESFRYFLRLVADANQIGPGVTEDEKQLLSRWKKENPQA